MSYNGARLTITPRLLVVTPDAQERRVGDSNPALTYAIDGMGLVKGDGVTGALATDATSQSAPGTYAITQGTLAASINYELQVVPGILEVTGLPILPPITTGSALSDDYWLYDPVGLEGMIDASVPTMLSCSGAVSTTDIYGFQIVGWECN